MGPRTLWVTSLAVAQLAALAATFPTGIGTAWWHHVASLAAVLAATLLLGVAWPGAWHSRRLLGIGVLATTVLAVVSGFYLLYWKEGIRVDGYQDWGVFWHVAWSWAAAVFFFQHTWVNRVAFGHFWHRSWRRGGTATLHALLWVVAVAGLLVTAGPGRTWFTNENYIPISLWSWLAAVVVAYTAWWMVRARSRQTHLRWRGGIDVALVPVAAAATVSGLPLLWFDPAMDALGLRYASKVWHVLPSVAFAVLVYVHSCQLWAALRTHWRRLGPEAPVKKGRAA